jgi:hypothetical protein
MRIGRVKGVARDIGLARGERDSMKGGIEQVYIYKLYWQSASANLPLKTGCNLPSDC